MKKHYPGIFPVDGGFRIRAQPIDPRTGRRREIDRVRLGITFAEAIALQGEWKTAVQVGVGSAAHRKTLTEYALSWLAIKLKILRTPAVRERYRTAVEKHILPDFGDWFLDMITPLALKMWIAKSRAWGRSRDGATSFQYSNDTINSWWRIFKEMLQDAVSDEQLPRDPTLRVDALPKAARKHENSLTPDELRLFLATAERLYPQWHVFLVLGFFTGMRPGELRALRWNVDVIPGSGEIVVQRSHGEQHYVGETKSRTARVIFLPAPLQAMLVAHRRWLMDEGIDNPKGLVFPAVRTTDGFMSRGSLRRPLKRIIAEAGIVDRSGAPKVITPKAMRRTFNDLGQNEAVGMRDTTLREVVGHQDASMTKLYTTTRQGEIRTGISKMVDLVGLGLGGK